MMRIQIRLSEAEYEAATAEAMRLGISFAELVRRSLLQIITVNQSALWMHYAGMVASRDPRSSQRIDEVVY
jgi:hypothetical protein